MITLFCSLLDRIQTMWCLTVMQKKLCLLIQEPEYTQVAHTHTHHNDLCLLEHTLLSLSADANTHTAGQMCVCESCEEPRSGLECQFVWDHSDWSVLDLQRSHPLSVRRTRRQRGGEEEEQSVSSLSYSNLRLERVQLHWLQRIVVCQQSRAELF